MLKDDILKILSRHDENDPIVMNDIMAQLGKPFGKRRRVRAIISEEIMADYPVGSNSVNGGYYMISTHNGLTHANREDKHRAIAILERIKRRTRSFSRLHDKGLFDGLTA